MGDNFSIFLANLNGTYEKGQVIIDITMLCNLSFYCVFSQSILGNMWENNAPDTEYFVLGSVHWGSALHLFYSFPLYNTMKS